MEAHVGDDMVRGDDDEVRDEDDHDLLTFNESSIRLREEITLTEAALRACSGAERRDVLQARLSALTDALARNTRQADAKPGEKGFLDYEPQRPGRADTGAEG
jgi:hypothetical protein